MNPHRQRRRPSLALPPAPLRPGEGHRALGGEGRPPLTRACFSQVRQDRSPEGLSNRPLLTGLGPAALPISQSSLPSFFPPQPSRRAPHAGESQQPKTWNWHLDPELWARSLRQQLNALLRLVPEENALLRLVPEESGAEAYSYSLVPVTAEDGQDLQEEQAWSRQMRQRAFLKAIADSEEPRALELLLAEFRTLLAAVLQDGSPAAWRYLHAVLGLLPPYRDFIVGLPDLLPFLEQLYCWAPKVEAHLQLDLLEALDKAFPPDSSLLHRTSHADCCCLPKKSSHGGHPCPFLKVPWDRQQGKELATWLRPVTLPELQHCLGIVGAQVALEEGPWRDGLSLLPLALATDIPVQYESRNAEEPAGRRKIRLSQVDYEAPGGTTSQKKSAGFVQEASLLGSQIMSIQKTERRLKKIHFLYLNVAPGRYFRPYNLVVVPPHKVNPEHYIFSPFGVLHIHPVEGSETMTLGTWHRHSALWQKLQSIPFFKNCLLRKALTCWKKNVRLQGLQRIKTFLADHLLLAVPHFGAGLLHISRLLQEFCSVSWLPKDPECFYELQDLKKALDKETSKALRLLCHCLNLCTSILHLVHEDTYHMRQGLQERVKTWNRIRKGQGSIYLQRVVRQQLQRKLKQAETWLLKLGKLARMVNYMICHSLASIVEHEITSFVANILQAPRQNPFLSSHLIFDDSGQLCSVPCIEDMIQILTNSLQSVKTSALQVVQSTDLKTSRDALYSEEEEEEQDSRTELLMPKFHSQTSDAVPLFCGPNVGLVFPWKSHAITDVLEVYGHRIRGQYLPPNYNQVQEELDNNAKIQQALTTQQALLEGMLSEVQQFCRDHQWLADIYEFLQAWGPQKLEDMQGCPIKEYTEVVSRLSTWQSRVSSMPAELLTRGKLLLLSCHDLQAELESKLASARRDILTQVQDECWSRNQQLLAELTDFIHAFQTISSDIHAIGTCSQKLNEAHEQYSQLEERVEYIRCLHELLRNHSGLYSAEDEALDIALLDMWEAFQFERNQASEFLVSKRHSIVPKLQQLMAAALAELEGLHETVLSGPFMDPAQDHRRMELQLIALEHQYQSTARHLKELLHAYTTFTGEESPITPPSCGTRPMVQQQRIWYLYRVISEHFSEWKCLAFAKFSLSMAWEKTDGWLTEAARVSTTLGLHSPVLHRCMRMLEEFRIYLPLLTKLAGLHLQNLNCQALFRALGLGSVHTMEHLTLGQLLNCPLLDFADRINQVWQCDNERIHAQENLQELQESWEDRQLRLLNFILHVPYEPPVSERSKRQAQHSPQWEVVAVDSGTFLLTDYSSLQESIQDSLQTLFKILAIQKTGDLHNIALEWVTNMHGLDALLEVWVAFQQKWIFLNKVLHEMKIPFPSADLDIRFKAVDDQYRALMHVSVADPMVLSLIVPSAKRNPYFQGQHLQQLLSTGSAELEGIIMALENVLYGVCTHFPRLFFLSDSELVALLAAPPESWEVKRWAQRCFPHVQAVDFRTRFSSADEKSMDGQESSPRRQTLVEALAVLGAGGEEVKLQGPLPLHPDLPKWLASLEKCLTQVLVNLMQSCVAARLALVPSLGKACKVPQQRQAHMQVSIHYWLDLVQTFPWQCVLAAEEIVWRAEIEETLLKWGAMDMTPMHIRKVKMLAQFIRAQRSSHGRQPVLSVRQTSLLSTLLVMAVTHRDTAQLLEKHQVSDLADFHWARQLKYHLGSPHLIPQSPLQSLKTVSSAEPSQSPAACWVDVLGRSFLYKYEYLGPRLGPLPILLHERPLLVLLLALEEVACGTLLGRDGMGKTETVLNLAWALGHQLVRMPCLPQIESRCLSNYLNGALQGGAWLLLEAAHRLPFGLLSALGQRLAEVQNLYAPLYREASKSLSTTDPTKSQVLGSGFFEKHHVSVCLGYGCFLTLRALSPGVPANLHLLLRPVALTQPDLQRVAELTLLSAGVRGASLMATRLSTLFSLERELVTGALPCRLPLLKQILEDTIQTLNGTKEEDKPEKPRSKAAFEEGALLHALLHSRLFSILDGLRLRSLRELLCRIFPSASHVLAEPQAKRLTKSLVVEELQQVGLFPSPDLLGYLEQLSQALKQASGILLLGPAGSGKTTCWNSLFKIQNRLAAMENPSARGFQSVEITHLYPSVLSSKEFLGWLEGPCWHYGIFSKLLRAISQCKSRNPRELTGEMMGVQHWVVCDGASSGTWLDSITCLLSDPPQLSLPNGQQIARPPNIFLLMEVADAAGMSPTVVSRCALVWCGGELTWQCMLNTLMTSLPREYRLQPQTVTELNRLAEVVVPAAFRFLARKGAGSLLQVHGRQVVCPGVAEITSLTRILHALLDPHLRLYEEEEAHGSEDLSVSSPVVQSFKSVRTSPPNKSQLSSTDKQNKHREHLLAVSSFFLAIIWGFGAHLPSRHWPLFDAFMRRSLCCLSNYPEPPPSAMMFELHVNPEDGTLVPFNGQYLNSRVKGTLGTFYPSIQTERLLYVVDLLLSRGQPVLLAGEAASGKSAFVEVLVEPNYPFLYSAIHPAFHSSHLRLLLSRGVQGQAQAMPHPGHHADSKGFLLFMLEDLHLAASDPEKSCQPVVETLRQAMAGTMYTHNTLELQTLQPTVNFLATVTVPGFCERPLCPRLFRQFTVLALSSMTLDTLLSRHAPSIQVWLERFHSLEREVALARALVQASLEAWEAVSNCFMPSPLRPHYRFSLHSVSHLLGSMQLLPTRIGSRAFSDSAHHLEHLRRVTGLRGTRLNVMMSMRNLMRLWLHEAQRTFCDRLDSPQERSCCAKLLLEVAQNVFCCGPGSRKLDKHHEKEVVEENVPEVESEGELAQWEDLSNSDSGTEDEEDPHGLRVTIGSYLYDPNLAPSRRSISRERGSICYLIDQEEGTRDRGGKLPSEAYKAPHMDLVSPLLLPVLLLFPQEKPSDVVFSKELILGSNFEGSDLYLERQWENLERQLATSAAQLGMNPHLARCHTMAQHVARLVRVLARPRQHGLLLSGAQGTGRRTAVTLATGICQARLFHLPSEPEGAILQCLRDASWHAGVLNQPVALLVSASTDVVTLHCLVALATSGSFPDQYKEADLDSIEKHFPENIGVKQSNKKEIILYRFYQQVCSQLHMFFLLGDDQVKKQLPSTLLLRLLQLAIASVDRYEPWDQASLVQVAQSHLQGAPSTPLDDGSLKCPDIQASGPSLAKAMSLVHLSSACYHQHLCPALPLVTPKTFLDFLDTFLVLQGQMVLKLRTRAQRLHTALKTLTLLAEQHSTQTGLVYDLEQQLKAFHKDFRMYQEQLEHSKFFYKQQITECRNQESLIENLAKQQNALQAQQEAFLDQMGKAFLSPLSQLQVADFEEIRSYRAPPEPVVQVTDALCELFHCETGWASAKQLLCTEDFFQELVFFPKEKLTDSELINLSQALKAPGMSDGALRAVSAPAANLALWLWALLHYGLAQRRGLPTGLLLRQLEAALAREQARLAHRQFQAQDVREQILSLTQKLEETRASYVHVLETLKQTQSGRCPKWPVESALLTPMHTWTTKLQKLREQCMTVFGDALLCSAAIVYLGPFPPPRRQELLDKWMALCRGFRQDLGPDDVAQALKQTSVSSPPKSPLLPIRSPFRILNLLSMGSEQHQWDRELRPRAKSARLAGLLLRSHLHHRSYRWPLLLDPSNQALVWLKPLPPEEKRSLVLVSTETVKGLTSPDGEKKEEDDMEDDTDGSEEENKAKDQTHEQRAEEKKEEEEEEQEQEEKETEVKKKESPRSHLASEARSSPLLCLRVLSGADPELGPRLQEAAANGLPVLLTNMELGLECPELQWLLQRERLSPPEVQPGFFLYLSTTLPLHALEKVLGCELLQGLNVLDLGLNMELLEEQMLHEILCRERPKLESNWQDLHIRTLDTYEAMEAAEELLLAMVLKHTQKHPKPSKFMRTMVRTQAKICQLRAQGEELEEQKLQEMALWAPYRHVAWHGMAMVEALSPLQNLLPFFSMSPENWLAITKQALDSMKPHDHQHGESLPSHLLQLKAHLARQLLGSTMAALSLSQVHLVGALGALALLQVTRKASKLEMLALWPGLAASPGTSHSKPIPGIVRPAWLGHRAWQECGMLELLPPFVGLRASLAGYSSVWQDYLSLPSTVLGPAPSLTSQPLSLLQKLILWRVLRPDRLAHALADLTTSLLGRPLDENLGPSTLAFEHSRATQPVLILLPPAGHPTATLHPVTLIRKLAASHEQGQRHLQVIALGSEAWDPVSSVVNSLCQAMFKGHWLVLDNCNLMPHWPRELVQLILGLLDGAEVVSDLESELPLAQPENKKVATVHRDFRLWLIVSTEASASLPAVLTQHSMPVFWDQSLELGHVLIDNIELTQGGPCLQPLTQTLPVLFLHGLLLHRQLYGMKLQAHRGRWSQVTLAKVLQTQSWLWTRLTNPSTAMLELAASVFYGGPVGDLEDREALVSLTQTCLHPSRRNQGQPNTPQHLLATLMPSPELGLLDATAECKAQVHLLPTPAEPRTCALNEGPEAWLLRRKSRALLSALQRTSRTWVPAACRSTQQRMEGRLRQRLVVANRKLETLKVMLANCPSPGQSSTPWVVQGPSARRPLEGFLETEVQELKQLVSAVQCDLDCLLQQLKGQPPCPSPRCAEVAQALWAGRLPPPWRPHAPAGPLAPWLWLRQLSLRGNLLLSYLRSGQSESSQEPRRVFHLSAFRHPRRLLLALRWEAALEPSLPSPHLPGDQGPSSTGLPHKRLELSNSPLHLQVENGPNPTVPESGLLLIGLQLLHAEWDPIDGALQDSHSSQPCPLPPVSVSVSKQAQDTNESPVLAGLDVYSCPVYMAGPLGTTKLHSRNILMHLPLPTKLSTAICVQRRVHVRSPPLS